MDTLVLQAFAVALLSFVVVTFSRQRSWSAPLAFRARGELAVEPVSESAAADNATEEVEAAEVAVAKEESASAADECSDTTVSHVPPRPSSPQRGAHLPSSASPRAPSLPSSPSRAHLPSSPPSHAHAEDSPAKVVALQTRLGSTISPALVDNDDALRRVLRARRGHVSAAADMLGVTQEWRRKETPWWPASAIPLHMIDAAARSGKAYIHGARDDGGPLVWIRAALHDKNEDRVAQRRFIIAVNDECVARINASAKPDLPAPQMFISVDFNGFGWAQFDTNAGITIVQTLSAHYPERLGRIVFFNTPFLFKAFWSVVKPFIDVRTSHKIVFLSDQRELPSALGVPLTAIPRWCGGTSDYIYNPATVLNAQSSEWTSIRDGPMPHLAPDVRLNPWESQK